jgi:hypothetical protein
MGPDDDAGRPRTRRTGDGGGRVVGRLLLVFATAAVLAAVPAARPVGASTGSSWSVVTTPATGGDDILLGSTCAGTVSCWAVGVTIYNISSASTFAPIVERWDGTAWSLQPTPALPGGNGGGFFDATCVTTSDCWAVGAVLGAAGGGSPTGSLAEHWDGTRWSIVPSPTPSGAVGAILQSVTCTTRSNCWAVGFGTDDTGAALHALVERWNGASWSIVGAAATGQAFDQLDSVTCATTTDCWAVGAAGAVQQNPNFLPIFPAAASDQGLIERWNGAAWSVVPSVSSASPDGGYLSSVTCPTAAECWASGSVTTAAGTAGSTLLERWDGSVWTRVTTPDADPSGGNILGAVACTGPSRCWAAGSSGSFGGGGGSGFQPGAFVEQWTGGSWSIAPSPTVGALAFLDSLTCARALTCWAVGSASTRPSENDPGLRSLVEGLTLPASASQGLLLSASDGGVFALGAATFVGSMGGHPLNRPIVGIAATPDGQGYWEVGSDGGVFAFGDAGFFGSMGGVPLTRPIVGIAATPDGQGYWEVASDGGVFAFGDAGFSGSLGGDPLNRPVVAMAPTPDGDGYWLVGSDGGVFAFGDAGFFGSTGALRLDQPITGIAPTPDGLGYWLVASDGGVFAFGDAGFFGSVPAQGIRASAPLISIEPTPTGDGYWIIGSDGSVFSYGDAQFPGSLVHEHLAAPVTGASW